MQHYAKLQDYVDNTRSLLQDLIPPYRYSDTDIFNVLNIATAEISRIRPDILLDMKYQQPLRSGDFDDWMPPTYSPSMNYNKTVPIPGKYISPVLWFMSGYLQVYDVTDTQDQRAQAFMQKFQQHLMTVSAA